MTDTSAQLCIVGSGPRGLSVLERICANERTHASRRTLSVHVVDPADPGAGAVWRTDQSRHLLMNTVASQVTVYTDDSARIQGPIEPGPSLWEWAGALASAAASGDGGYDSETLAEAKALGPDDYPTRALYGRYLRDCFDRIVAAAPSHVLVERHRSRAVAIADTHGVIGGPQGIRLQNGTRLHGLDAVVLAQGHVPARLTTREARAASLARIHDLTYLPPANPADVDLGVVAAGEHVLIRGLGLNFFDYLSLFTIGRGGRFVGTGEDLTYLPSGREPRLFANSRRGIPYQARGENQKGVAGRHLPLLLTPDWIAGLRRRRQAGAPVSFNNEVWPLIRREVESVYYATLLRNAGTATDRNTLLERFCAVPIEGGDDALGHRDQLEELLDSYGVRAEDRWNWERLARPYGDRTFDSRAEFSEWLLDYLARDAAQARAGNVEGPVKAALDVLRDLRNEVRLIVDHGGLDGESHREDLDGWYTAFNAFLSVGPPVVRIDQLRAVIRVGVITLTGPGTQIVLDTGTPAFVASSKLVPGPPVSARVLIEARLPEPDLRRTEDPLMRHLLDLGQACPYRIPSASGQSHETGGLAVTERPYRLLDSRGNAHPRRFAFGIPTEAVHWVTAAGIRPGVDSVTLGDSDSIARAMLALGRATASPHDVRLLTDSRAEFGVVV